MAPPGAVSRSGHCGSADGSPSTGPTSSERSSTRSSTVAASGPSVDRSIQAGIGSLPDETVRRLQPDEPAPGRRDANGAAAIGGGRHGHQPRRHRRRRPTAGSSGAVVEAPRIARRAEEPIGGEALRGELGQIGLADDDRARLFQAAGHDPIAVGGRRCGSQKGPAGGPHALHVLEVLDQHGHAAQRAGLPPPGEVPILLVCLPQRFVKASRDDGIEVGIQPGDAVYGQLDEIPGADVAPLHSRHQFRQQSLILSRCVGPGPMIVPRPASRECRRCAVCEREWTRDVRVRGAEDLRSRRGAGSRGASSAPRGAP